MKKLIAMILALAMMLSLAACGGNSASSGSDAPAAQETAPAGNDTSPAEQPAETVAPVDEANLSDVQLIIKEAEGMTLEELAQKGV